MNVSFFYLITFHSALISTAPAGVQLSGYLSMFLESRSQVTKGHSKALGTKHSLGLRPRRAGMNLYQKDVSLTSGHDNVSPDQIALFFHTCFRV